jgi:aspartate-semialdehyde dehydrogenase
MRVGVVGATGLVGSKMIEILAERQFPVDELRLFASPRSAGKTVQWQGRSVEIEATDGASFKGLDVVLLSAGGAVSKQLAPRIAADGAIAIDNSSAWRMDPDVPLVVSEVNPKAIDNRPKGIVANPNCTTMIAMPVLAPLSERAGLQSLVVSSYQAVSGAGEKGNADLANQFADPSASSSAFAERVAHNVVPLAGSLVDDETDEEHKFRNESRKILDQSELTVSCTCVRVPVYVGHSLSVEATFSNAIGPDDVRAVLSSSPGVALAELPTPLSAEGGDVSLVGRIRQSSGHPNKISLFISGDNLRKGAALNAVQLAELLV